MKVSLNWAQHHSKVDLKPDGVDKLVEKIGAQLGEVEGVYHSGAKYEGIIVVKVVSCEKHPNADKLSLCLVDDGKAIDSVERNDDGLVQVVCGAPNVKAGMLAAWIPSGAIVPSTFYGEKFTLEARELRGEISNGMLASPQELAISDEHEGILEIVDAKAAEGIPLRQLYGLDDVMIDIENKMFTHRPDCFGVLGVARELAGIQHLKFESPDWYLNQPEFKSADGLALIVKNEIPELVPRFMAVAMSGVQVAPSPVWLQAGLMRAKIKSINNIVDITNYLMYLTGQPIHAYDYDKVAKLSDAGAVLSTRHPNKGEKLKLLNGKTIEPRNEAIMIATDKELIGVGGVMGGSDTEVDESTKNIIIECASFDLYSIRRTSMEHGLFTDAVTRFSKGQSPLQNDRVLAKAMELVDSQAGGKQASEVIDDVRLGADALSAQSLHPAINVSSEFINQRLGLDLKAEQIVALLQNTEFVAEITRGSVIIVKPPFWRTDIQIAVDIVEEVGRLYGYDNLPLELPGRKAAPAQIEDKLMLKQQIREALASLGANETLSYSFVHGKMLENARQDPGNSYRLNNALSPDLQYYRQTLMPSLLAQIHPNIKAGHDEFALFELNKTHNKLHGLDAEKVPGEINMIACAYASKAAKSAAYYEARAYLDQLAAKLGLQLEYAPVEKDQAFPVTRPYDLQRSALVSVAGSKIFLGIVGEYHHKVRRAFKLPASAAGFEIGLEALLEASGKVSSTYAPLSKYPPISQDICLQVSPEITYAQLETEVQSAANVSKPDDVNVTIAPIDIYMPDYKKYKNITFSVTLVSDERTLQEAVASKLLDTIAQACAEKLSARRV